MKISITEPNVNQLEALSSICSIWWKQTVEGKLSDKYQKANIAFWFNLDRIKSDIENGGYTHIALDEVKVVGVIGGGITESGVGEKKMRSETMLNNYLFYCTG